MVEESCWCGGVDRVVGGWCHWLAVACHDVALVADGELCGCGIDAGNDKGAMREVVWDGPVVLNNGDGVVFIDVA